MSPIQDCDNSAVLSIQQIPLPAEAVEGKDQESPEENSTRFSTLTEFLFSFSFIHRFLGMVSSKTRGSMTAEIII